MSAESKVCSHCGWDFPDPATQYRCGNPKCPWPLSDAQKVVILTAALQEIAERHIPDQPGADNCDEATYARKQHTVLRVIAVKALKEMSL